MQSASRLTVLSEFCSHGVDVHHGFAAANPIACLDLAHERFANRKRKGSRGDVTPRRLFVTYRHAFGHVDGSSRLWNPAWLLGVRQRIGTLGYETAEWVSVR